MYGRSATLRGRGLLRGDWCHLDVTESKDGNSNAQAYKQPKPAIFT
jgi:hypothetical protein